MLTAAVAILVWCIGVTGPATEHSLDADYLRNLMAGLQHELRDLEFVYEGSVTVTYNGKTEPSPPMTFQGQCALRSDGCAHLDIYSRSADQRKALERSVLCLSKANGFQTLDFQPDRGSRSKVLKSGPRAAPSVLDRAASPFRVFRAPMIRHYLEQVSDSPTSAALRYEYLGWETVDRRRCVKIRFASSVLGGGTASREFIYWIDLERGGNPLKYEDRADGKLRARVEDIRLEAFPDPAGREHWLPVHGVFRSYLAGLGADRKQRVLSKANYEEKCDIVKGTVRVNQDLRDERFSLDWSGAPRTEELRAAGLEHEGSLRRRRPSASREETVDRMIAEALRQGELLEASSPSRAYWPGTLLGQGLFVALGTMSLLFAWFLKRRFS